MICPVDTPENAMNSQPATPPPVPRLDPAQLIQILARDHGVSLELFEAAPGGEVGAAFVRWPDGREGVLTRAGDALRRSRRPPPLDGGRPHARRQYGVPAPRYDLIAQVGDTHAVIQERLPGTPPHTVDRPLVDQMIAATTVWADLLADRPDLDPASLYLTESGPGFCLHESLAGYDHRTRRLLGQIHEIGRSGAGQLHGDDLVHLDYHAGNVLVDSNGRLTGIIDWDGWSRGDRWFSLEVLSFDLSARCEDAAARRLLTDQITEAVGPDSLRAYRASLSLRLVDWSIRHHGSDAVDFWLGVAAERLGTD